MNKFEKKIIYNITLSSILMSISILFKCFSQLIPIFQGYSLELEIIPYVYGIICIKDLKIKSIFIILCPILWWILFPGYSINATQIFIEHFLVYYIYSSLMIVNLIKISSKSKYIYLFFLIMFLTTILKLFIHVIAGIIWWTNGNLLLSIIINLQIIFGNLAINMIIFILTIKQICSISLNHQVKNTNNKIKKYYI